MMRVRGVTGELSCRHEAPGMPEGKGHSHARFTQDSGVRDNSCTASQRVPNKHRVHFFSSSLNTDYGGLCFGLSMYTRPSTP